jgi:predicted CXXCH cytochrome family protein
MTKRTGLVIAGALVAMLPLAAAYASITGSKHDLSSASSAAIKSSATDQICIFCHTPHKAQSTQVLWNHTASLNSTISWGGVTQTSGGTLLPTTVNTRSMRCLSCHDGSVALGDVTNFAGTAAILPMTGPAGTIDGTGKLTDSYYIMGASGNLGGNHPIGIPYPGQAAGQYNGRASGSLVNATEYVAAATITGSVTPTVKLFADTTNPSVLGIECGSCHDVHNSQNLTAFLWKSNAASALCLSCHIK